MDDQIIKQLPRGEGINQDGTLTAGEMSPRKARLLYESGFWRQAGNYVGMCVFVPWSNDQLLSLLGAVTGWSLSGRDLADVVERGMALARIFNLREGFSTADDTLPQRFFSSAADGPLRELAVDRKDLEQAQQAYFLMLGWDAAGIPTQDRLKDLDIAWACRFLS
jgi:aldehyde:ferredoxin oxidoreductase